MTKSTQSSGLILLALLILIGATTVYARDADEGNIIHTPWLGLRFQQHDGKAKLVGSESVTEVYLKAAPFTIIMPVRGENDLYQITALDNDSIFEQANHRKFQLPPYFNLGTGMADTSAGSGILMLEENAHHYLSDLRLGPDPYLHEFHVSEIASTVDGVYIVNPVEETDGPLYLVVWFDEDNDGIFENGEYERLVLHFGQ